MASPQKEYGYTSIANEIMDALVAVNMSGHEFRIALFIVRKTYGFNKCEDAISLSQMMLATGMSKVRCSQIVNRLELRKIVTVTEKCNGLTKKYKFNKDFEQWEGVTEKCNGYRKVKQGVTKKRNAPLQKSVTTKDNITKDNLQKTYLSVFAKWNEKKIIRHADHTKFIGNINAALKNYSMGDICTAIDNYATVLSGDEYFWSYKWGLKEFLQRGLERFVPINFIASDYLMKNNDRESTDNGKYDFWDTAI